MQTMHSSPGGAKGELDVAEPIDSTKLCTLEAQYRRN